MKDEVYNRFKEYDKEHCWQYELKLQTLEEDLKALNMSNEELSQLRCDDFEFTNVPKDDKVKVAGIRSFIKKYEWLGNCPNRPTHWFAAYHKKTGILACAVIMAVPNTFSYILGSEYKHREKLISRGASVSWAPKNLGSWMLSRSIEWMAKNTSFCVFSAYSDPEAKELGSIYQGLNFYYLGQSSGTVTQYFDPKRPHLGWCSSRNHRHWSAWHRYATEIGHPGLFKEHPEYCGLYSPNWKAMPDELKRALKKQQHEYTNSCQVRLTKPKHKYILIKGKDKKETKYLQKRFETMYTDLYEKRYDYPKARGQ